MCARTTQCRVAPRGTASEGPLRRCGARQPAGINLRRRTGTTSRLRIAPLWASRAAPKLAYFPGSRSGSPPSLPPANRCEARPSETARRDKQTRASVEKDETRSRTVRLSRLRAGQISRNWQDFHRTPVIINTQSGEKFQQLRKTCTGVRCFQVRPRGLYRFHRSATEHALTEFPQSLVRNDWESVSPVPIRCAGHRSDVQISRTSVVPLHSAEALMHNYAT